MEENKIGETPVRNGFLAIKKEFLLQFEEKPEVAEETTEGQKTGQAHKNFRGMNKKRRREMSNAREETRKKEIRICPSVIIPNKKCKFAENCRDVHSIEAFMAIRPTDIGEKCVVYDAAGSCPYGVSCRFGSSHTNEDFTQRTKDPDESYKPVLNTSSFALQVSIRKREYDFKRSEEALKKFTDPATPIGAMEREKLKLDTRSFKGKPYLAPLTTVGNLPFRRLCVELGAEITCGEMAVATNFLKSNGPNEWPLLKRHPSEKIFGVQLAGGYPDTLSKTAQIVVDNMEVDFIDLNLGCPIDLINEAGGGCTLANRPNKLCQVLKTMQAVMKDTPLTIKMRYGMKNDEKTVHRVMKRIVETCPPQLITLHPRSKEQRYTKLADWDYVPECVNALSGKVPLWVCGDVFSHQDYYNRLSTNDIGGIMIGRGALIKPWLFTEIGERRDWDISATERLDIVRKFANYGLEHWGSDSSGVETTRRFMLEWMSFAHRYVPLGILEHIPQKMNQKPPAYFGRSDLETLLSSKKASDWVKVSEMFLGPVPEGFLFVPKHKANSY